eukprot:3917214-Pleurochrysis_carterae.AAC.1
MKGLNGKRLERKFCYGIPAKRARDDKKARKPGNQAKVILAHLTSGDWRRTEVMVSYGDRRISVQVGPAMSTQVALRGD